MKMVLLIVFMFFTSNSFATLSKTKILHVSVNISKSYGEVFMYNNEQGDIDHFEWRLIHPDRVGDMQSFSVEDLRQGTVFRKGVTKKYLKLRAPNFSALYGGEIQIRYPENIITRRYNSEKFEVTRNQGARADNTRWPFNHRTRKNFRFIKIIVNRFFGAPIGADKIQFL